MPGQLVLMQPEPFPDQPLAPVSVHSPGQESLWNDDAKAGVRRFVLHYRDRQNIGTNEPAGLEDFPEFRASQACACPEGTRLGKAGIHTIPLDGQTRPSLGTTGANHCTPTTGFHALEKAVCALALDDGRLVGSLHD